MKNRHKAEECAGDILDGLVGVAELGMLELSQGIDDPDEWFITVGRGKNPKCICGREWSVTLREEL